MLGSAGGARQRRAAPLRCGHTCGGGGGGQPQQQCACVASAGGMAAVAAAKQYEIASGLPFPMCSLPCLQTCVAYPTSDVTIATHQASFCGWQRAALNYFCVCLHAAGMAFATGGRAGEAATSATAAAAAGGLPRAWHSQALFAFPSLPLLLQWLRRKPSIRPWSFRNGRSVQPLTLPHEARPPAGRIAWRRRRPCGTHPSVPAALNLFCSESSTSLHSSLPCLLPW